MLRTKRVIMFVGGVLVLFVVLSLPWPGVRSAYMAAFRSAANALIKEHVFGRGGRAGFLPPEDGDDASAQGSSPWHARVLVANMNTGTGKRIELSIRNHGYVPMAALLALVALTPLPWWRRLLSLVAGLAILHVLIFVRMLLPIIATLAEPGPQAPYDLSDITRSVLEWALNVYVHPPGNSYILPLIVWVLVAFRLRDWYVGVGPRGDVRP